MTQMCDVDRACSSGDSESGFDCDTFAVAVDVETTGCFIGGGSAVVAIGAAIINVTRVRTVETRRWTFDVSTATWEPRCIEQFWSKFPQQLKDLTTDLSTRVTPSEFVGQWSTWLSTFAARLTAAGNPSDVPLWSDFPHFDLAWLSLQLVQGGGMPLYYPGWKGWQSSVDIDAFVDGMRECMPSSSMCTSPKLPLDTIITEAKELFPDGNHYPEKDAECMGLRFAYLLSKIRSL